MWFQSINAVVRRCLLGFGVPARRFITRNRKTPNKKGPPATIVENGPARDDDQAALRDDTANPVTTPAESAERYCQTARVPAERRDASVSASRRARQAAAGLTTFALAGRPSTLIGNDGNFGVTCSQPLVSHSPEIRRNDQNQLLDRAALFKAS